MLQARYIHIAKYTPREIVLLIALPLLTYHALAIPPLLAAALSFMLQRIAREIGRGDFNPAPLSYAGATIGVVSGTDLISNAIVTFESTTAKNDNLFISLCA